MKTPIDTVKGRIVDVDQNGVVTIKAKYDDLFTMCKRQYREVYIQMIDSRPLSEKQRNACYALIRQISDFTGMGLDPTKEYMKIKFLAEDLDETADKIFSLSNAPMSLVCAFQKFLVRFILDWDIPCDFPLLNMVDDVEDYIYACATRKKCCICGHDAEPHHHERIGMGGNRRTIDQTGMLMEPLCRMHHTECHTMSQKEFDRKYHIEPVAIDDTLKKVWGFSGKRKRHDWLDEWFSENSNGGV